MVYSYICAIDSKYWKRVTELITELADGEVQVCVRRQGLNMFMTIKSADYASLMLAADSPSTLCEVEQPVCVAEKKTRRGKGRGRG